jgi:hypothetical protein
MLKQLDNLAEREGFYFRSFRYLAVTPTLGDFTQCSRGFQAYS